MTTTAPYFPPLGERWERVDADDVGWTERQLVAAERYAAGHHSSGLLVLCGGRILLERDWSARGALPAAMRGDPLPGGRVTEDVASMQKSVVSILVGIAIGKGLLSLDDPVGRHVGAGWSGVPADAEAAITVRHLLTMTSGLDARLGYAAPPGTLWFYSLGASYHTLKRVLSRAARMDLTDLTSAWLLRPLGMTETTWRTRETGAGGPASSYPDGQPFEGLVSSARDLGRFCLAVLAGGTWGGTPLGLAEGYLASATSPSSELNPSYGYLWWLNGRDGHRTAGGNRMVDGPLLPGAPSDLIAAQGAFDRLCHLVPSLDLAIVRLGGAPGQTVLGPSHFGSGLWESLSGGAPPGRPSEAHQPEND
ncbi:MAG: serine hydrolase [Acidimicrobiales bacterium]